MYKLSYCQVLSLIKRAAEDSELSDAKMSLKEQRKARKKLEKQYNKMVLRLTSSDRKRRGQWYGLYWGPTTSKLILAALGGLGGATAGAIYGKDLKTPAIKDEELGIDIPSKTLNPALVGGIGGATLGALGGSTANAIGRLAGSLAGPRSLKRQVDRDSSLGNSLADFLLPGVASFNKARLLLTSDELRAIERQLMLDKIKAKKGII